jgi:hypothetical protein
MLVPEKRSVFFALVFDRQKYTERQHRDKTYHRQQLTERTNCHSVAVAKTEEI